MKRLLLFVMAIGFVAAGFSQYLPYNSVRGTGQHAYAKMVRSSINDVVIPGQQLSNGYVSSLKSVSADPSIFQSYYDMQSNYSSGQQRIYQFPDGSIGGVGTMGTSATGTAWPERGTGYNYSSNNGTTWGPVPTTRVETNTRTGWPSYQPWGANGECIIAHQSAGNLVFSSRATKGTGAWTTTTTLANPSTVPAMLWPRMVTSGANHMTVHVIALTEPTANGGVVWNGMDGALCYARSTDGGATWSAWQQLPGTNSANYVAFVADTYAWAMPHGDTLAFVSGYNWTDEFMMKSTDNGNTWTKTVIYNSPYNLIGYGGTPGDNGFYCPDNTSAIALDYYGNAHVCFGLQWDSTASDGSGVSYLPNMNGLVYWNETMPQLPQSLDPNVLFNQGNLVAWQLDTTIFWAGGSAPLPFASFYVSLTSNPSILIDHNNDLFLIYSTVTAWTDNSPSHLYMRHIFERTGKVWSDGSFFFHSAFTDLNSDFTYNFLECVFGDLSQSSYDNKLHLIFQSDTYAGSYVRDLTNPNATGQQIATNNSFFVMNVPKPLFLGVNNNNSNTSLAVSSNFPNPYQGSTSITVNNPKPGNMSIEVINMVGQRMSLINYGYVNAGSNHYTIDGSQLSPGVYFYIVKVGTESHTGRMIVD